MTLNSRFLPCKKSLLKSTANCFMVYGSAIEIQTNLASSFYQISYLIGCYQPAVLVLVSLIRSFNLSLVVAQIIRW